MGQKGQYNNKMLEQIERFRMLLLQSKTRPQMIKELKVSSNTYDRIVNAYRQIYYNPEEIERKANEDLEKLSLVDRKAFDEVMKDKIGYKDYVITNEHYQKTKARYGYAPTDKVNLNVSYDKDFVIDSIKKIISSKSDTIEDKSD
jgi:hypothetical protein